jgi:hypothetical protein
MSKLLVSTWLLGDAAVFTNPPGRIVGLTEKWSGVGRYLRMLRVLSAKPVVLLASIVGKIGINH